MKKYKVAPHPGAWIEIVVTTIITTLVYVAPHPGAWIEIPWEIPWEYNRKSRTPPGCVD